jgi:hypothetical protein
MAKRTRHTLTSAEARYKELVAELKLLSVQFPHLRDAVDQDELPINFILKRGADKAEAKARASAARRTRKS